MDKEQALSLIKKPIDIAPPKNENISCFKCKNFQLGLIVFALLVITTTLIVIVPITLPEITINENFMFYALMYGLGFGLLALLLFASILHLKWYCDEKDPKERSTTNLIGGFSLAFLGFIILLSIVFYLPASLEEYPIKLADESLREQMILNLSCRTFEMSYAERSEIGSARYAIYLGGDWEYFNSTAYHDKHEECKK